MFFFAGFLLALPEFALPRRAYKATLRNPDGYVHKLLACKSFHFDLIIGTFTLDSAWVLRTEFKVLLRNMCEPSVPHESWALSCWNNFFLDWVNCPKGVSLQVLLQQALHALRDSLAAAMWRMHANACSMSDALGKCENDQMKNMNC